MRKLFQPDKKIHSARADTAATTSIGDSKTELAVERRRLFTALTNRFANKILSWKDCSGKPCDPSFDGQVLIHLSSPLVQRDKLEEVLGLLEKVMRALKIEKVEVDAQAPKDQPKYYVTSSGSSPDPLELLGPLTADYIRLQSIAAKTSKASQASVDPKSSADAKSSNWKSSDAKPSDSAQTLLPLKLLSTVDPLLMQNLLVAFERKKLRYDLDPELVFNEAIVRLTMLQSVTDQINQLKTLAANTDVAACQDCQKTAAKRLLGILNTIMSTENLSADQAKAESQQVLKFLPDDLYRQQTLCLIADKASLKTVPGLNDAEAEKDMVHTTIVTVLVILISISSPIFAFILIKELLKKTEGERQELSAVTYGWKRMLMVAGWLIVSVFVILIFEAVSGCTTEFDNCMLAIKIPILCAMNELISSSLINSTMLFVFFAFCIPKGIGFSEGFGLRGSTSQYSFKQLCSLGIYAYLALNAVTISALALLVVFHHPETSSDQSSGIARALSMGAGGILFFVEGLLGPLMEELCFRGVLYRGLRTSWGVLPSLIVSSLWFAVLHGELAPWLLFHKFAVGGLNALLYEKTRSLTPAVVSHCLNNVFLDLL